jgi:putative transposase
MVELLDCTPAEGTPMTDDRLPLAELMAKADDGDFLRSVAESVLQILMEADVEGMIGATSAAASGPPTATAIASGRSTRAWAP